LTIVVKAQYLSLLFTEHALIAWFS